MSDPEAAWARLRSLIPFAQPRAPRRKARPLKFASVEQTSTSRVAGWLSSFLAAFFRGSRKSEAGRGPKLPEIDATDCAIVAPPATPVGRPIALSVVVLRPEQGVRPKEGDASAAVGGLRRTFRRLEIDVERGAEMRFRLELPGLGITSRSESLIWQGAPAVVRFDLSVPLDVPPGALHGVVFADLDTVPVGLIKFTLDVVAAGAWPSEPEPRGDFAYPFRRAFISYAPSDRPEVLKRAQMLAPLGIDFYRDVFNREPGERWEDRFRRYVDECDLFLLFWSRAARRSETVLKEVQYARERRKSDMFGRPEIRPVHLESPPLLDAPPEISELGLQDGLPYFVR